MSEERRRQGFDRWLEEARERWMEEAAGLLVDNYGFLAEGEEQMHERASGIISADILNEGGGMLQGYAATIIREIYAKGVMDTLQEAVEVGSNGSARASLDAVFDRCRRELKEGEIDAAEAVARVGVELSSDRDMISSEEIIAHPDAVDRISDRLARYSDPEGNLLEIYSTFAETFEELVSIFSEDVAEHISNGGSRVGPLIVLTYVTACALHKARILSAQFTIAGSSRCFRKGTGAVKRILYRLRENNPRAMEFLEGEPSVAASLPEILSFVRSFAGGEGI